MLSVNIPVYNIDVGNLVQQLLLQADTLNISYEIRVYDDCSSEPWREQNRRLGALPNVIYSEMPHNLGRAAIRNTMGLESRYPYLLFIDADSSLVSEHYLKNYLDQAQPETVLCGGTAYSRMKPSNDKLLRWIYGIRREAIGAEERTRQKGFIITSNNFMIDRELFRKIHFRTNLGPYGHEDTLLGYDLFRFGITPLHIDNPVEHNGLENSPVFLHKSEEALKNLHFISEELIKSPDFFQKIHFLDRYKKLTRWVPPIFLCWFYSLFKSAMRKNLIGKSPRLFLFDIYKVACFACLKRSKIIAKN